jgi:hypothetical protein
MLRPQSDLMVSTKSTQWEFFSTNKPHNAQYIFQKTAINDDSDFLKINFQI